MNIPKLLFLSILLAFCCSTMDSHAQVTSNVYTRVLKIHVGKEMGTAFTMDVDGRQYLITAKHMIADLKQEDSVDIYKDNQWSPTLVKVLKCEEPIDIAVLIPSKLLTKTQQLESISASHQIVIGQDVFFIGFPFGLSMSANNLNGEYPFALVKKGILSAIFDTTFAIDGFNNPGFSGGPIVFHDKNQPNSPLYVAAVITGFLPELSPVMTPEIVKTGDDTSRVEKWRIIDKDGQKAILRDTEQMVGLNTGIVIGYSIKHAIDLILKNPIGPKIIQ
jgi:hypothetical protein